MSELFTREDVDLYNRQLAGGLTEVVLPGREVSEAEKQILGFDLFAGQPLPPVVSVGLDRDGQTQTGVQTARLPGLSGNKLVLASGAALLALLVLA